MHIYKYIYIWFQDGRSGLGFSGKEIYAHVQNFITAVKKGDSLISLVLQKADSSADRLAFHHATHSKRAKDETEEAKMLMQHRI